MPVPDTPLRLVVLVVLLSLAAAATWRAFERPPQVIAARHDLEAGAQITVGDVVMVDQPATHRDHEVVPARRAASVLGRKLRQALPAGAPFGPDCCEAVRANDGAWRVNQPRRRASLVTSRRASTRACRPRRGACR